jgi:hypothetical protein
MPQARQEARGEGLEERAAPLAHTVAIIAEVFMSHSGLEGRKDDE